MIGGLITQTKVSWEPVMNITSEPISNQHKGHRRQR
jgi:hypothetical protein